MLSRAILPLAMRQFMLVLLWTGLIGLLLTRAPALASQTGTWTLNGTGGSATAAGVTITISGIQGGAATAGTMNATNFWSDPYGGTVAGTNDITIIPIDGGGAGGANTQTVTVSFNKPVTNPVLHVDRIGGINTTVNTSIWTLSGSASTSGSVTLSKLAGNNAFLVTANSFQRVITGAPASGGNSECVSTTTDDGNTACGTVQFTGTGITSLTFTVTFANPSGLGDGIEFKFGLPDTKVIYKKQSLGGTAAFTFSGTNGVGGSTLNTASTNPATSATYTLADNTSDTTITEAAVAGYELSTASCVDQASAAITSSLSGLVLTIPAASIASVSGQTISCTFTNSKMPTLTLSKTSTGITGTFTFTGDNGWASQNISTVTSGVAVSGATQTLAALNTPTTITEAGSTAYVLSSASCTDSSSAITGNTGSFGTLSGQALAIPAAKVVAGATFQCSFANAVANPSLSITKTYSTTPTPAQAGQTITYTYVITNTGNVTMSNVKVKDMHGTPSTQIPLGSGGITGETLTTPGPLGAGASPAATPNDGIWTTLAPGASVTMTYTHTVTQAEIDHG